MQTATAPFKREEAMSIRRSFAVMAASVALVASAACSGGSGGSPLGPNDPNGPTVPAPRDTAGTIPNGGMNG
jgi:hypothetical protein